MPTQYCFLCASDEGVFLDITTENKETFCTQFKICSLVKVPTTDQLPAAICHKCVYELNQCSAFLQKYKKFAKNKHYSRKKCCNLCFEQTDKEYTFNLKKKNILQLKSIDKIQQILNDETDKIQGNNIVVCLSCRYTVDVLCDLKNLSNEVSSKLDDKIEKDIDYSSFSKVKTTVVNRKTTITDSERATLKLMQNTDSESETMKRTRSKTKVNNTRVNNKVTVTSSEQICEDCDSPITADSDAHKNEKTGQNVCKVCWESNRLNAKDVETQSPAETKVCKVFLKDVLSQPASQKGKQADEIEKNNQNKKRQRTTAKQSKTPSSDSEINTGKQVDKRSIRSTYSEDPDYIEEVPTKRAKRGAKEMVSEPESLSQTKSVPPRTTRNRKYIANNERARQISDSDSALSNNNVKESRGSVTAQKRVAGLSLSDADVEVKRDRKRLKSILTGNVSSKSVDTNDGSSTDDSPSKRKKLRFKNDASIFIDLTTSTEANERPKRSVARRTAANAEKVTKPAPAKKSSESEAKDDSDLEEETMTLYSCDECGVNYENKLVFLTHKLTHCKQPKLELKKMTVESKPKEVSPGTSDAADEQFEDQSEAIKITVDDDEEEAEMESNSMNSSADTNLSMTSRTEEVAVATEKETPKDTATAEVSSKEFDADQPIETDDTERKSLRSLRSRSLSGSSDKANAENALEMAEEETIEDISLTNIEDDQDEEEGEEEKVVHRESNKQEKSRIEEDASLEEEDAGRKEEDAGPKEDAGLEVDAGLEADAGPEENATTDAVEEEQETEKQDAKKSQDTSSEEKCEEEVDVENVDSSEMIDADKTQEETKLDSSDGTEENKNEERNDDTVALPETPEKKQVDEKEGRKSPDASEERPEDSEKLELSDKDEASPVKEKDHLDIHDTSEEVRKDTTDSPGKSEETRVTRKSRSVSFAKLEEKDKHDSPESPREKPSSPGRSEERRSPRRSRSSPIAKLEETAEEKDTLGSPVRTEGRKSTRKTRSSLFARIEEEKQDSPEKSEENVKLGSPSEPKEKRRLRKSKSSPVGNSEEKDNQDSSEEPKSNIHPSEETKENENDKDDVVIEIQDEDSCSSVIKEVCEKERNDEIGTDDAEDVQVVKTNDYDSDDVEEVSTQKDDAAVAAAVATATAIIVDDDDDDDDDNDDDDDDVQCVEMNCSNGKSKSSDARQDDEDIVEVAEPTPDSTDIAAEILQEVLNLASAEIDGGNESDDAETLENISREVQNGGSTKS